MLARNFLEKFFANNEKSLKYAIFDFDKTIYPGISIYELAAEYAKKLGRMIKNKN